MADQTHMEHVEEQAALFALGALTPEEHARFAQRVDSGCPVCQAELRQCEQTAAALTFSAAEVSPPPSLRARLLASIKPPEQPAAKPADTELTMVRKDDTPWKAMPFPGVETRPLLGKKTLLVRMQPKSSLPAHDHEHGAEQCLVLEGSISCDGTTAYAGDFTYMPRGSKHHALYSEDGCLLLIAYT